jgi:hypothetical protein
LGPNTITKCINSLDNQLIRCTRERRVHGESWEPETPCGKTFALHQN